MTLLNPIVMTDIALFRMEGDELKVLLLQRANAPEQKAWALPGGILRPQLDESLDATARRVIREKTGIEAPYLEQVHAFSGSSRDPRGFSISVLYQALFPAQQVRAVAGAKADAVAWVRAERPGRRLAFDHARLLSCALATLREKVALSALPLHLLAEEFTLSGLQMTCEAILGRTLDKSAFRRRLKGHPALEVVPGRFLQGPQRPAQLYRASPTYRFEHDFKKDLGR